MKGLAALGLVVGLCLAGSVTAAADSSKHEFRVGVVVAGGLDDPFNAQVFAGLNMAQHKLHIEANLYQAPRFQDPTPTVRQAAQNSDLVIAAGFFIGFAVGTVSGDPAFANVHFVVLDGFPSVDRPNEQSLLFKVEESGALVGAIAGVLEATSRAPKSLGHISAIGALLFNGSHIDDVDRYIAGYRWGARLVDPSVDVRIDWLRTDFFTPGPCHDTAAAQIGNGADIVFPVAGGCSRGAYAAASEAGVDSVGVDLSQKAANQSVIVSAVKRYDMATYDVIKSAVDGEFQSGVVRLGLNDDATGYTVDNFDLPVDVRNAVARVERQIESGKLTVPTSV